MSDQVSSYGFETAARTICAEAESDGEAGMRAVAAVIVNRLDDGRWGDTLLKVCLAPAQFSCWNTTSKARTDIIAALDDFDATLCKARAYLSDALDGHQSPVGAATHYYNPSAVKEPPAWVKGAKLEGKVGSQIFFSGVK
ncbi:MAG TPA: cell wall hydrolase [Stellaceae bacterium]|nr:cell wall hydrolase [Stellaceae bacterium]